MTQEERAQEILTILRRTFSLPDWATTPKKPFATLIRTVLSQATNDKNRDKAFKSLSEKFHITPTVLSEADVKAIEEAIRIGGLYRNKSRVIKELSRVIVEKFNGTLDFIYSTSLEEARKLLMALPGIGPKTADVVLLFSANKPVLPVDTHVNRVSKRLELAASKADYERVRLTLQSLYSPNDYLAVHILLIMLGRKYCKARHAMSLSKARRLNCGNNKRSQAEPS